MPNKRIGIQFGVLGGGSLSGGSGEAIKQDIEAIVGALQTQKVTALKFTIDPNSLSQIKSELSNILGGININLNSQTLSNQVKSALNSGSSGMSGGIKIPAKFVGVSGEEIATTLSKLKGEIEELSQNPVEIKTFSSADVDGNLQVVGARLKYINAETGTAVTKFYSLIKNANGVTEAILKTGTELGKAVTSSKAFNAEFEKSFALKQIDTLSAKMGDFGIDLTKVKQAANNVFDEKSLQVFKNELKLVQEELKKTNAQLKSENSFNPIAASEKRLANVVVKANAALTTLGKFQGIPGVEKTEESLRNVILEWNKFQQETNKDVKIKIADDIGKAMAKSKAEIAAFRVQYAEMVRIANQNVSESSVAKVESRFSKTGGLVTELSESSKATQQLQSEYKKLIELKDKFDAKHTAKNRDAYYAQATVVDDLAKNIKKADIAQENFVKKGIQNQRQLNLLFNEGFNYYEKFKQGIQKTPALDKQWTDYFKLLESKPDIKYTQQGKETLSSLMKESKKAGVEVENLTQKLKRLFESHISTTVAVTAVAMLQQVFMNTYQSVVALDRALVNLQIATGMTRDQTKTLIAAYSEYAKELGATTGQVAAAADDWLRQGYSIKDTNILIKDSLMLSKLGQISSEEATTALTSAMKGYKMTVQEVTGIVDKFSAVDMKAAVSSGYIAKAMAETANSARIAGVDINKLTGYIATVGEVTQDGAEQVGNFYKTLFSRMGNVKQKLLSDPETGDDLSNVESALRGVGIQLRDSDSEFRNFGTVLDEVASRWTKYSSVQQRAIAVAFSGTRQQEKFLTLMENYGKAVEYTSVATNSAGTALQKYNDSYLQSVQASQEKAKASFEAMANTIMNSDIVKGVFQGGAGFLGFLNDLIKTIGIAGTLIGTAGIGALIKGASEP